MRIRIWVFALLPLVVSACGPVPGGALPETVRLRPAEEIIDGPLEVTGFAADGSAVLPVRTTIPVACSIVYGETPEFGSIALDQDMAGGAHADHSPLLTGLKPETTYYFRLQGVDDEGVVYVSEVMTFTTPPQGEAETDNLASPQNGAEVTGYSSAFGGAAPDERWGALGAFDDNPNTAWSSSGDGDAAWIEVRLAQPAQVRQITYRSRVMTDGTAITLAFTVTTETGEVHGPYQVPEGGELAVFEVEFTGQTLRFDLVQTTGGNTGAVDIAVFGTWLE